MTTANPDNSASALVPNQVDEKTDTLVRQIQSKVDLEGKDYKLGASVPFSKLLTTASAGEKCKLYLGWLFAALTGAILPCFFFFLGPVFDSFGPTTTPETIRDEVREICIIMGILAVAIFITSFFQNYLLMSSAASIAAKLKTLYLQKVLDQESAWYDQTNYLELASRIGKECDQIQSGIGQKYGQILYALCMCISGFVVAFVKGWTLAFAMFGIGPIMMIVMGYFASVQQQKTLASMKAYGQSAGYAEQALSSIRVVVSFGQESLEISNYSRFLERVTIAGIKAGCSSGFSLGFFFFCIYLSYGYSFLMGAIWVDREFNNPAEDRPYLAGDCISVFFGVLIGLFSLGGAGPAFQAINVAKAAGKSAFDVIDRKPTIFQDDPQAQKHQLQGQIEFKNVDFFYPSRPDAPILRNFSYAFELGKTTAIVGPSGSGKSTTVQLIERFYDPNNGEVLIDGKNLKSINLRNYRQQIGYVGQEPVLFNTTIKQNLLMGKPDATDAEIKEALQKTNAWDFVNKYQDGINSNVGVGGGQLSGGQKQRIALARAFLKKPRVLIFDEATSALDKVNEAEVQKAIDQMKKELGTVTTVVIAHRLSTVRAADQIIVMKKGKIAEIGSHESLLRDYPGGIYAKLAENDAKAQAKEEANAAAAAAAEEDMTKELAQLEALNPALIAATKKAADKRRSSVQVLAQKDIKEKDPVSKAKLAQAEQSRIAYEKGLDDNMQDILDAKKQDKYFSKNLAKYANPTWAKVLGVLLVVVVGIVAPMFGWWVMEAMNNMNLAAATGADVMKEVLPWIGLMFGGSFVLLVCKSFSGILLSRVAENLTTAVRNDLYQAVMRKDIGWHDDRDNSAGVMTATLASDVQLLNGVSSDGLAVQVEGGTAVLFAICFGFAWSWPMALVGLGTLPVIIIAGAIVAKADNENMMNVKEAESSDDIPDDVRQSQILSSDSIQNYKTVASFGNDQILLDEYDAINSRRAKSENKSAYAYAFALGLSVALQNAVFAIFYLASAELFAKWPTYEYTSYDKMYIAMFVIIFGFFTAAQSISIGPDVKKAKKAAIKIFYIIARPSRIDVHSEETKAAKPVRAEGFNGEIEFKDVWFRYPTRLQQWVFKGLNLKINANDAIAVVGESGQGKSTFISLVMRFYDPEFGTVLIDGVDVKTLNVNELRMRIGLVMQEPLLFNYSLAENILYGKLTASNDEVYNAAQIANALEFIESKELSTAFDDNPASLKEAANSPNYKETVLAQMGQERFKEAMEILDKSIKKQEAEGKFDSVVDLVDTRTPDVKGAKQIHEGFRIMAGNRGSKLSGGQKQRIAIARAVVRQPGILLLDEATSALDEDSQKKVQEALYEVMKGRTSIVVAHRLTTVKSCNRLAVIEDGKIVEEGSFDELTSKEGGFFANLAAGMRKAEEKEAKKRASLLVGKK